jgi:hypothetical protein
MKASPEEATPLRAMDEDLSINESVFTDFVPMASGFLGFARAQQAL